MQTSEFEKSKGFWETLQEGIWSEAFYGLGISILLTSNPSIQVALEDSSYLDNEFYPQLYTAFDKLKHRLLKDKISSKAGTNSSPEALSAFMLGAISKCAATCLTCPAIRCKVMIQATNSDDDRRTETEKKARILKTVLSSALLLMVKEKITKSTWLLMLMIGRYMITCLSIPPPPIEGKLNL